jgi:hypothetical protein
MADKTIRIWNRKGDDAVDVLYKDLGNGKYAMVVDAKIDASDINIGNIDVLSLPALVAGEAHIGSLGGKSVLVSDETIRVADTIPYVAGDVISATVSNTGTTPLRSLAVGRVNGGSGYFTKFRLMTNQVACVAALRIHFFSVPQPTGPIVGDNVAMTFLYANAAYRLGHLDMPSFASTSPVGASDSAVSQDLNTRFHFKCAVADNKIYYRIETLTAFTPISGQKFFLEAAADQD